VEHINFWSGFLFVLPAKMWKTKKSTGCPLDAREENGLKADMTKFKYDLYSLLVAIIIKKYWGKHQIIRQFDKVQIFVTTIVFVGRDSSVGIATRYGLDGPGIESQGGARFSAPVQTGHWGPPSLLYNGCRVSPGGKAAGAWSLTPTSF